MVGINRGLRSRHEAQASAHIIVRGNAEIGHHRREVFGKVLNTRDVIESHPAAVAVRRGEEVAGREPVEGGGVPEGKSRDVAHALLYRAQRVCADR